MHMHIKTYHIFVKNKWNSQNNWSDPYLNAKAPTIVKLNCTFVHVPKLLDMHPEKGLGVCSKVLNKRSGVFLAIFSNSNHIFVQFLVHI